MLRILFIYILEGVSTAKFASSCYLIFEIPTRVYININVLR